MTAREQEEMLLYRPRYRYPERAAKPDNLAQSEAIGSGLTPVYADLADHLVNVETPSGERLAIDDHRLMSLCARGFTSGMS